jgi:Asp-tRNA(Asn)/Glu-tRNA(Gln) amidotransferase B subunit
LAKGLGLKLVDEKELTALAKAVISENTFAYKTADHNPVKPERYYMGRVTKGLGGRVSGTRIREIILANLKNGAQPPSAAIQKDKAVKIAKPKGKK